MAKKKLAEENAGEELQMNEETGTEVVETGADTNAVDEELVGGEVVEEAPKEEKAKFFDANGNEISKSAFIKDKFVNENMSRAEISEKFGFDYRVVYGATVNMKNDAETTSRGRSSGVSANVKIDAEGNVVDSETVTTKNEDDTDNVVVTYYLNGVAVTDAETIAVVAAALEAETTVTQTRKDFVLAQVAAGVERAKIASKLRVAYGVVYALTKDEEGAGKRNVYSYEVDDETAEGGKKTLSRSEYIRHLNDLGKTKKEIATELGVEYNIVWQALKAEKTPEERFAALKEQLKKFGDAVEDPELFGKVMAALDTINLKPAKEEGSDEAPVTEETPVVESTETSEVTEA